MYHTNSWKYTSKYIPAVHCVKMRVFFSFWEIYSTDTSDNADQWLLTQNSILRQGAVEHCVRSLLLPYSIWFIGTQMRLSTSWSCKTWWRWLQSQSGHYVSVLQKHTDAQVLYKKTYPTEVICSLNALFFASVTKLANLCYCFIFLWCQITAESLFLFYFSELL